MKNRTAEEIAMEVDVEIAKSYDAAPPKYIARMIVNAIKEKEDFAFEKGKLYGRSEAWEEAAKLAIEDQAPPFDPLTCKVLASCFNQMAERRGIYNSSDQCEEERWAKGMFDQILKDLKLEED